MKSAKLWSLSYILLLLFVIGALFFVGCSQPSIGESVIESSIKTERLNKFVLGKIFIDTRKASAAFLVLKKVENGAVGESVMIGKLPLGRHEKLTITLNGPYQLKPGKQKLQVSVFLDGNKNGTLDDTDPLAQGAAGPMQKIVEIEVTSNRTVSYGTFADKIHTRMSKEFEAGNFYLGATSKYRFYLVIRLIEDGKPGKVLGLNELRFKGKEHKYKASLEHQFMKQKQQIHMAIYRVTGTKAWKIDKWDPKAPIEMDRDGKKMQTTIDVTFESSVSDPNSPYYAYTCGEYGERYIKNKTKLFVDCRCTQNRIRKPTFFLCNGDAVSRSGYTQGKGPRLNATKGHQTSGDVWPDRNEIIFGIDRGLTKKEGGGLRRRFTIAALNYKTNTRRFVSGEAKDPAQGEYKVGKGPLGQEVTFIRRGPDNKAYLYSNGDGGWIMRVDLDSGDREVIWKRKDKNYGQCSNGVKPKTDPKWRLGDSEPGPYQNTIEGRGFTVGPDGSFYLGTTANGVPRPGYAIIRISKDGKSCKVISTSGAEERNAYYGGIGKGYNIEGPIASMTWHNGKLLAITWAGDLLEVNPTTGDRRRVAGSRITGSGSLPASYRIFVDPSTKLLMLTGFLPPNNPGLAGVNLETGKIWTFRCLNVDPKNGYTTGCMRGPMDTKPIAYWPGYRLPNGQYIGGFTNTGFSHYEITTGNSYIYSF